MKRFVSISFAVLFCSLVSSGCRQQPAADSAQSGTQSATASPSQAAATPNAATAAAVKEAMSKSGVPAAGASPAVAASIPPAIPEALRRPLTLEQICALPPATRDMILKAQGRPNACDSLKKK